MKFFLIVVVFILFGFVKLYAQDTPSNSTNKPAPVNDSPKSTDFNRYSGANSTDGLQTIIYYSGDKYFITIIPDKTGYYSIFSKKGTPNANADSNSTDISIPDLSLFLKKIIPQLAISGKEADLNGIAKGIQDKFNNWQSTQVLNSGLKNLNFSTSGASTICPAVNQNIASLHKLINLLGKFDAITQNNAGYYDSQYSKDILADIKSEINNIASSNIIGSGKKDTNGGILNQKNLQKVDSFFFKLNLVGFKISENFSKSTTTIETPKSVTLNSGGEIYRGSDYIPTPDISKLDSAIIALNESKPKEDLKTRLSKLEKAVKNIKSTLSAQILIMKTQNRYNVDSIFIEIRGATLRASTLWIDGETYHLKEQCYPMKTRYDYELLNKGEFYFVKNTGKEDKIKLGDLLLFEPLYNAHNDNYAPSDTVLKLAKNFFSGGNCISLSKERAANYFRINLYSDFLALFFQRPNSVVQTEALFYCYMNTKHGFSFSGNVRDKTGTRTGREKWLYFNSIFPILNVAKFDNSISKLNVLYGSYPKENDTVAHANALDIYHFSYLKMGLGINIISHYIREWSTYTYFNYEPMVLLTTMHDSIPGTKDLARVYDLTSWANKFELVFKVRQDRTWGLNAGFSALQLKVQKRNNISPTYSQVYGQPVKDNIYNPLPYPGNYFGQHIIDPNSMIYSSEVEFFYSTNSANSSRIYLKMRYTTLRLRTDGYPEILVGYSADIRSIKFK